MSLYSALYAGVSGLSAQASAMATVADNITNINTVGYKGTEAQFRTLVTGSNSGGNYAAGGVMAASIAQITKQGLPQASASNTDIAIDGGGFFVTRTGAAGSGDVAFTRAGSFKPDEQGYLRNASGLYLYGWRLDDTGGYTNTGSTAALESVRLSDLQGTAAPTTTVQASINLQSSAAITTGYAVGNMAKYAADPTTGTAPSFQRSFDIFDAQGGSHRVTMGFVKTAANEWQVETYAVPAGDVSATDGLLVSGTLRFNGDGSLDRTMPVTATAGSTPALFAPVSIGWTNDSNPGSVTFALGSDKGIDGMTSFGDPSALKSSNVNGGTLGNLASIEINKAGIVRAVFDDGTSRAVFQLPLATFQNPDGLTRLSGNAYTVSQDSGSMTLNAPGALGAGAISANALEASTVDLAGEFTNMIRFQRAYSASSKIITTVDDMLREVSDLKR
ncbi:flagellar hook protein FlgE [Sphingomonas sp. CJ20]